MEIIDLVDDTSGIQEVIKPEVPRNKEKRNRSSEISKVFDALNLILILYDIHSFLCILGCL